MFNVYYRGRNKYVHVHEVKTINNDICFLIYDKRSEEDTEAWRYVKASDCEPETQRMKRLLPN